MTTMQIEDDDEVILVEFENEYGLRSVSNYQAELIEKSNGRLENRF
jgi:hypothetical protein